MGREIKRVALDFNPPLNEVWAGYRSPDFPKCPACNGTGSTVAQHRLDELVYLIMQSGEDAARGQCHPYFRQIDALHRSLGAVPGKDMADLTTGLAGREPGLMGHDTSDNWRAAAKIVKAAGMPKGWGTCKDCKGHGLSPKDYRKLNRWKPTEPPAGDAYQLWSTTTEGSPMSPPFATPEELAHWLADNKVSSFGSDTATYEQWLKFIGVGWAPSMISIDGILMSGVDAAAKGGQ